MDDTKLPSRSPLRFRQRGGVQERCCTRCNRWKPCDAAHFVINYGKPAACCRECKNTYLRSQKRASMAKGPPLSDVPVVLRSKGVPPPLPGLRELVMGALA